MFKKFLLLSSFFMAGISVCNAETYLIDVRTPDEFASEHIAGALNIEYQNIISGVKSANITPNDSIYVYCRSGKRADAAKNALVAEGFKDVTNLGGIEDAKATLGR